MDLIQLYTVRVKAAQAVFARLSYFCTTAMLSTCLACNIDLVAAALKRFSQHFFRTSIAIEFRCVKKVDAGIYCGPDYAVRVCLRRKKLPRHSGCSIPEFDKSCILLTKRAMRLRGKIPFGMRIFAPEQYYNMTGSPV